MATITQLQTRILEDISEQATKISYGTATDSFSSINTSGIFGVSPSNTWLGLECTADGELKCSTTIDTTGLATDTLQTAGNTSLATIAGDTTSLDSKIVACDTSSLSTSALQGTANGHLSTIAGDTTSLDSKIVACDTSSLSTSALQTTGNTSLSNIDTTTSTMSGTLTSVDGKMSSGADASLSSAQQVVVYGRDSGGALDALKVDAQGHLEVVVPDSIYRDVDSSSQSITTTASGTDVSNTVDNQGYSRLAFAGTITDTTDGIEHHVSHNGSDWYLHESYFPTFTSSSPYPYHITVSDPAFRYHRLSRTDSSASAQTWVVVSSQR